MRGLYPFRRLRLRTRLTLTFAFGAALLSAVLSITTWGLTRENLLHQKEESAIDEVIANAVTVRQGLGPTVDVEKLIASLPNREGAQSLIQYRAKWTAKNSVDFGQDALPPSLRVLVDQQEAARMLYDHDGKPFLAVGVPIPAQNAAYYEGVSLVETQRALTGLAFSLFGASLLTTLAGGLVGFWVSRRALAPLVEVGNAAKAIAGGELDTRLKVGGDPELDVLTISFNEMAGALQDRIERDARFASEVSHELRSPLMTVAASVEVLENSRDEMSERGQTALDLLKADVDRFQQLVEDLLEISRFDVGAVKLNLEEVVLPEMVIQAVSAAGVGPVPIMYEDNVSEAIVMVDKRRFGRVIANLLDNAHKYAGGAARVRVAIVSAGEAAANRGDGDGDSEDGEPGRWAQIAVEDEGNGVVEEERLIIFDRFSRGSEGGNRASDSGVGLGLALVDEHIRLHGGRTWVEDRLDGKSGARFVVELPLVED
jgi:two-component system sensor histidine kinase MtrB